MEYKEFEFPCCVYCGDPSTQKEHVLPQSKIWMFQGDYVSWILPSCQECNYLAGAKMFKTFGNKTEYIHIQDDVLVIVKENEKCTNQPSSKTPA